MVFRRRLKATANLDLIPMIDVVFQLVVFFMVTSTFDLRPGVEIEYPESQTTEQVKITSIIVTLEADDRIYINKEGPFVFDKYQERINGIEEAVMRDITAVVIQGDAAISYSLLVKAMDVLRIKGFKGVNLRLTPKRE